MTDARLFVVMDVDGVLNRIPAAEEDFSLDQEPDFGNAVVMDERGIEFLIRPNLAVVHELDELVHQPGVQLCWLTTWGTAIDRLVERAFGGKLDGGTVIASRPQAEFVPIEWKLEALLAFLEEHGGLPYVWADDDAIAEALGYRMDFRSGEGGGADRLLIAPDGHEGLSLDDIELVREFVQRVLSR
jgi:hypothetical protein